MAFRIHKGIFQNLNAAGTAYENAFKVDRDGVMKTVSTDGTVGSAFLKVGDKASDADNLDGINSGSFLRSDAHDSFSGNLTATTNDWYIYGLGTRGASAGAYGIGNRSDDSYRQMTFHVPNQAAYSSSGTIPSFGWYSNGATQLMKLNSDSGNLWLKGSSEFDGRVYADDGLHVRGDWLRVNGSNGIYFESYGGGWRMTDSSWIRAYNDKNIYTGGTIETSGVMRADNGFQVDGSTVIDGSGVVVTNINNDTTDSNYFIQAAHGQPRNNLGSPTVTEMALFNEQFNNKTAFLDPSRVTVWKQQTNGAAWEDITANYGDAAIRRFIAGYDSSSNIFIPNGVYSFRIEVTHPSYVFANAVYFYWSSQSHSTKLHLWCRRNDNNAWYQFSASNTNVSSWPGHLYMPFSGVAWHPSAVTSSHYNTLRFEFIPNWSTGTYSDRNIDLYKMQVWGGYPAGTRFPYTVNEYGDITARRNFLGTTLYEGGTQLSSKYLGISSKAADSNLLDGIDSGSFLRSDASDSFSGTLTGTASAENLKVGGIRGTAKGSQTGDYIHLYERVHIGGPNGWGAATHGAPGQGLSTWGSANFGMNGSSVIQLNGTTIVTSAKELTNVTNRNWDIAYGWGNHASAGYSTATGVENNANNYSLPAGSSTTRGGFKIGYAENGKNYPVEVSSEKMYVNVPWTDNNTDTITSVGISGSETTGAITLIGAGATSITQSGGSITIRSTNTEYSAATTSATGLMSSTDKTKLDGIAAGANVTPSWVPATDPSYLTSLPSHNHDSSYVRRLADNDDPDYYTPSSRRVNPNAKNPTNEHYAVSTFGNDGNVTGQLATHFQTGEAYTRGFNSSWSGWRRQWDSSNFDPSTKLGVTAKAADSNLLDGINSTSFLRSDANDTFTGTITMGKQHALVANNYGRGVYGVYSSTKYQHVWGMGTAYNLADDGSGTGNLYGIAWTHSNIGGESISGLGHQMLIMSNGDTRSAIGDGIWTKYNIYASGGNSTEWNAAYTKANAAPYINSSTQARPDFNSLIPSVNTTEYKEVHIINEGSNFPSGAYAYGVVHSQKMGSMKFQWYVPHTASRGENNTQDTIYFRTGWGDSQIYGWQYLIHSGNIAGQSVGYASSAGAVAWGNVSGKPSTFSPSSHNHDDRYYTETESDARYLQSLPSHNHNDIYYTETEVDTLLATKAASSHTHGIGNITDAARWWNNFGDNHTTRTSFDAQNAALTTGFGWRYVQGNTNGPGTDSSPNQFYALTVGLGNDYNYDNYGMQLVIPRNTATPYISVRFEENRVLGAWQKISAGYADSAGTANAVAWSNVSGKPSTFSPSAHTHTPTEVGLSSLSSNGNALAGSFTATGDITAYSDSRVKENVTTIDNALDKVMSLRGVEYNKIGSEEKSLGVIAQEIREVLPEVVKEQEDGMLSVAYGNITAVLIEALKEQQKQIDELKAQIDAITK